MVESEPIGDIRPVFQAWKEADLSDDELRRFAETLTTGVRHFPMGWVEHVRLWVRGVCARLSLPLPVLNFIFPVRSKSEHVRDIIQRISKYDHEGHAIIARVGGDAAAYCSAHSEGKTSEGRTKYALTSVTLPQYQKQGLNSVLREKVVEHIERVDPAGIFITGSKNPIVITRCRRQAWVEIGYEQFCRERGNPLTPSERRLVLKDGWTGFMYDPKLQGSLAEKIRKSRAAQEQKMHTDPSSKPFLGS